MLSKIAPLTRPKTFDSLPCHDSSEGHWMGSVRTVVRSSKSGASIDYPWIIGMVFAFFIILLILILFRPRPARRPIIVINLW